MVIETEILESVEQVITQPMTENAAGFRDTRPILYAAARQYADCDEGFWAGATVTCTNRDGEAHVQCLPDRDHRIPDCIECPFGDGSWHHFSLDDFVLFSHTLPTYLPMAPVFG